VFGSLREIERTIVERVMPSYRSVCCRESKACE